MIRQLLRRWRQKRELKRCRTDFNYWLKHYMIVSPAKPANAFAESWLNDATKQQSTFKPLNIRWYQAEHLKFLQSARRHRKPIIQLKRRGTL